MLMKNMLRADANLRGGNTVKENDRPDKKNMDIKEDEERLKGSRKKKTENTKKTCISSLIFSIIILFYEVAFDISFKRSDLFIIWKFCFNIFWRLSQSNVHLFTIDLRPYLSVLKLLLSVDM